MVTPRLQELLARDGRGATERLAARLQLLASVPGWEDLAELRPNAITELINNPHTCPDKLAVALCLAWGRVDLYWLLGLRDDPTPPADVRWPSSPKVTDCPSPAEGDDESEKT